MFGKIISIFENQIKIENTSKRIETSILNLHLIFEYNNTKEVGEITEITEEYFLVNLVGEIIQDKFYPGNIKKPSTNSSIRLIYKGEVATLLGNQDLNDINSLYLGKSLVYDGYNVSANINEFFSNHFAIIGNTGSGKSCSVASIIQNLFKNTERKPKNAHMVLFDVYGEYDSAFESLNQIEGIKYKNLTTKLKFAKGEIINIPAYFLEVDDLALLLGAEDPSQLAIIEKALKLVYIFTEEESLVKDYKNNIIAKALLDILSSGRSSTQIRDQIIAVLTTYNTQDINLNSSISQPGYVRTLKQCLNIDGSGKLNTVHLVVEFLESFSKAELAQVTFKPDFIYSLKDLYYAFEFALISEGILKSDKVYDRNNILKIRLDSIINSEEAAYFEVKNYISKPEFIKKLFSSPEGDITQILNINLNYIDERFARVLTKVYSKLLFDFATSLEDRASFPVQIILEEAHRYVQNDTDIKILGYNIFDRITKEGRKYGIVLGLITQRPSELSNTALSQCSNFIVFRMYHPEDLKIISSISSNITMDTIEKLKTLRPGVGLCFGVSFKLPSIVKVDFPSPPPQSTNSNIIDIWYK